MAVKLTWYGHACWRIESAQCVLLIDPFFLQNPKSFSALVKRAVPKAKVIGLKPGESFDSWRVC